MSFKFEIGDRIENSHYPGLFGKVVGRDSYCREHWYAVEWEDDESKHPHHGRFSPRHEDTVHLAPKEHVFGGVRFIETGEVRLPKREEPFWHDTYAIVRFAEADYKHAEYPILKPVEVI